MHLLGLDEIDSESTRKQPFFAALGTDQKLEFIHGVAKEILDKYIKFNDKLELIQQRTMELDRQRKVLKDMFVDHEQRYVCSYCDKKYKRVGNLKGHLQAHHDWMEEDNDGMDEDSCKADSIAIYRASFLKCALLLRDTNDAYQMADGDRIEENAKFQLLLSHVGNHTKYQLWLFRFLAYIVALLSPRMAYEYKWNCTSSLRGGREHNIPNDNLVEIQVHNVKKKIQDQGANCTYASARRAALTLQVQHEMRENMKHECLMKPSGTKRPEVSKINDLVSMVKEIQESDIMDYVPGREFCSFPGFRDIYSRVKTDVFHKWLSKQKERLSYEIV